MNISAIILAAGQSKRMGRAKLALAWENSTVLGKVIETLEHAGLEDILAVTGGARIEVETILKNYKVRAVWNENFEGQEMLASIQIGLRHQATRSEATLICLGDQPQIQENTIQSVCKQFENNKNRLIVPSYQMRRGHPWLIARVFWDEVLQMHPPQTMRDFLSRHNGEILYVEQNSPSILQDLDTPEDYLKFRP